MRWRDIGASGAVLEWILHGVKIPWRRRRPPPPFNHGTSLTHLPPDQAAFRDRETERLIERGVFRPARSSRWISRAFLVPKPTGGGWRLVIDLRTLNTYCQTKQMKMETLKHLRTIAKPSDWMVTFDLEDGFYALGIAPEDRDYFSINLNGQIFNLCALPQGWSLSPYVFHTFTYTFIKHLRDPEAATGTAAEGPPDQISGKARRRWFRRRRRRTGARLLPFVDDFALFESSLPACVERQVQVFALLDDLGLKIHPNKGYHTPVQAGLHLGLEIDFAQGVFRAPASKLAKISTLAKQLLCSAAASQRWIRARALATLAGMAQFLYLAIPAARFYLRELHDVADTRKSWSHSVKMTRQLKRDLEWWAAVPTQKNSAPIWRPVETAYMHCDSSSFGWGAVLNNSVEARGFWQGPDRQHITWKELKAVRLAVESFLKELRGRRLVLHEDNQAVVAVLTSLTSRSPAMMSELRKLFYLIDTNEIYIRPLYIRSAANIWADRLSRELDRSDWRLHPRVFAHLDEIWGGHTVDRFASRENRQLPRYNARWRDGAAEAVDSLCLPDLAWQRENNWCNPPWELLDDLVTKLRQSGAAATVIAPRWPTKPWFHHLSEMAAESIDFPPSRDLFSPWQRPGHEGVGSPGWSVVAFRLHASRPGSS